MKRWFAVALAVVSLTSLAAGQKNQNSSNSNPTYTVGILPFSDLSGNEDIGHLAQALAKLIQGRLLESSSLVARLLDSTKSDSDSDSDSSGPPADAAAAAALGKARHADLVLIGQILSGNVETKEGNYSGPNFRGLSMGSKSRSQTSTVVLQVDVIDVNRGERIGSFRATGRNTQSKIDPSVGSGYGSMDMTTTGFKDSSLGKATEQALGEITAKVIDTAKTFTPAPASNDSSAKAKAADSKDNSTKAKAADAGAKADADSEADEDKSSAAPAASAELDGMVADVSGKTLTLNVGKSAGVQVGDKLKIVRTTREIKDPASGNVIRRIDTPLGTVTITEVGDAYSVGTYSGTPGVKVNDHVKR